MGEHLQQFFFGMGFEEWFESWRTIRLNLVTAGRDCIGFLLVGFIFRALNVAFGDRQGADMVKTVSYCGAVTRVLQILGGK